MVLYDKVQRTKERGTIDIRLALFPRDPDQLSHASHPPPSVTVTPPSPPISDMRGTRPLARAGQSNRERSRLGDNAAVALSVCPAGRNFTRSVHLHPPLGQRLSPLLSALLLSLGQLRLPPAAGRLLVDVADTTWIWLSHRLDRKLVFKWSESVRLMALHQSNTRKGYGGTAEDNPNSKSNSKVQKRQGSKCMMRKEIY